jgi:hypothetical protein
MTDDEQVQRSRLAARVSQLWGDERATIDAGLIESAAAAMARIYALRPEATVQLDDDEESSDA